MGKKKPSHAYLPPVAFYFSVELLGQGTSSKQKVDAAFQEVSGISAEMQYEEIREGGENRFVYKVPNGVRYDNLVLKRGMVVWPSEFASWCRNCLANGKVKSNSGKQFKPQDIMVKLLDPTNNAPIMSWSFIGATPVKWEVNGFNAMESNVAIETLTFTYQYFNTMDKQGKNYFKSK